MKNKIIILLIFIVPLAVFALLQSISKNQIADAAIEPALGKGRIIKFYSPMCSECKTVGKNVEKAIQKYEDVVFEEIDVTEKTPKTKYLIDSYKITVVPTVVFIDKQGNVENKTEGAIDEIEIENHLEKIK